MDAFDRLRQFHQLADDLAATATREQLVDCAKFLALNLAQYQARFGELPFDGAWDFLASETMSEGQALLVAHALESFVGMLGNITGGLADDFPPTRQ